MCAASQRNRLRAAAVQGVERRRILGKVNPSYHQKYSTCTLAESWVTDKNSLWACIRINSVLWFSASFENMFVCKNIKCVRICFKMSVPSWFIICLLLSLFSDEVGNSTWLQILWKVFYLQVQGETCGDTDLLLILLHARGSSWSPQFTQSHCIMEWLRLEGAFKGHLVHTSAASRDIFN